MEKYGPADTVFHIQKVEVIKCNHCMCKRSHSILQQNMLSVFQYSENKDGKTSQVYREVHNSTLLQSPGRYSCTNVIPLES